MLLAKLAIALVSAALSAFVLHTRALERMLEHIDVRAAQRWLPALVLFGYLAVAVAIHTLRGASADLSDASGYYFPAATAALRGELVYRDFESSYAPLFSYLAAACVAIWRDPRVFAFVAVVLHALTLAVWLRAGERHLEPGARLRAALLFVLSGHGLINVTVGQNQVWLALSIALSAWLAFGGRAAASGLALGGGLAAVKLLAIVFGAALWPAVRNRVAFAVGGGVLCSAVYGGFAWLGADVTEPLIEGALSTSGNLPYLLSLFGADPRGIAGNALLIVGVALGLYVLVLGMRDEARSPTATLARCAAVLLVLMLFSRKAFTSYLVIGLFPLCWVAVATRARSAQAAFLAIAVLAPLEPSLWFRWLEQRDLSVLWTASEPLRPALFALIEVALVAAYAVLLWHALALAKPQTPAAIVTRNP